MTEYMINVFFSEEDDMWVAEIPDLPGCSAMGSTAERAVSEVHAARDAWLAAARAGGRSIPEPRTRPATHGT